MTKLAVSMLDETAGAVSTIQSSGELRSDLKLPTVGHTHEPTEDDAKLERDIVEG